MRDWGVGGSVLGTAIVYVLIAVVTLIVGFGVAGMLAQCYTGRCNVVRVAPAPLTPAPPVAPAEAYAALPAFRQPAAVPLAVPLAVAAAPAAQVGADVPAAIVPPSLPEPKPSPPASQPHSESYRAKAWRAIQNRAGILCPPGTYMVSTYGPTVIDVTDNSVKLTWSGSPSPTPLPPTPNPLPPVPPGKHAGPLYLSLIQPSPPTAESQKLLTDLLALDKGALLISGVRTFTSGDPQIKIMGLDEAIAGKQLPLVIVQERPAAAKPSDYWPIVGVLEDPTAADVETYLKALLAQS